MSIVRTPQWQWYLATFPILSDMSDTTWKNKYYIQRFLLPPTRTRVKNNYKANRLLSSPLSVFNQLKCNNSDRVSASHAIATALQQQQNPVLYRKDQLSVTSVFLIYSVEEAIRETPSSSHITYESIKEISRLHLQTWCHWVWNLISEGHVVNGGGDNRAIWMQRG